MKSKLLALALLTGGSLFAETHFSLGIGIGGYGPGYYAAPPPPVYVAPPYPGPDYYWVNGSWFWNGPRRVWRPGYWNYRPYGYRRDFDRRRGWDRDRDYGRGYWRR
jgi:hypothetical protein